MSRNFIGFGIGSDFFYVVVWQISSITTRTKLNQALQRALEVSKKILKMGEGNIIKNSE